VLVSHGHYDHLDVATLSRLAAKFAPRVITPLGNDVTMREADSAIKAEAFDWHDRVELGNGLAGNIGADPALVGARPVRPQQGTMGEFCAGDPCRKTLHRLRFRLRRRRAFPSRCRSARPVRLAILPIGAYEPRWFMRDQHMNPEDAVKALADCGAQAALAHHHGTFQLTDEAIEAPVIALGEALDAANVSREKFAVLKPGRVVEI